ncbi:O-antigen ligase family protein [bacterium]|nr:O-antigen ligase family protein [bacterium]
MASRFASSRKNLAINIGALVVLLMAMLGSNAFGSKNILLLLAFVVAVLTLHYPLFGWLLLVFMIPLESAFLSIGGGVVTYTRLLGILLCGLWVLKVIVEQRPIIIIPYAKWFLPLIFWAVLSIEWAGNVSLSLSLLMTLLQMFVLGFVMYNEVHDAKQLGAMLFVLMMSCALAAIIGYFKIGSMDENSLLKLGGQGVKEYATMVGTAFLSGIILFSFRRQNHEKIFYMLISVVCIYPLFAAGERGVILGLAVGWIVITMVSRRKFSKIAFAFLICLALYGFFHLAIQNELLSNYTINRFHLTELIKSGGMGRIDILRVGLSIVKDRPIFGIGLGNFPVAYLRYSRNPILGRYIGLGPHNDFLGIATELGIIGLFLFIGMIVDLCVRIFRLFREPLDHERYTLLIWLFGLWFYCLTTSMTSDYIYRKFYWLLIALIEIVIRLAQQPQSLIPDSQPHPLFHRESYKI